MRNNGVSRVSTLTVSAAYTLHARAMLESATCACGMPARRVTVEYAPVKDDYKLRKGLDPVTVRTWCGHTTDAHVMDGDGLDAAVIALDESDL